MAGSLHGATNSAQSTVSSVGNPTDKSRLRNRQTDREDRDVQPGPRNSQQSDFALTHRPHKNSGRFLLADGRMAGL